MKFNSKITSTVLNSVNRSHLVQVYVDHVECNNLFLALRRSDEMGREGGEGVTLRRVEDIMYVDQGHIFVRS